MNLQYHLSKFLRQAFHAVIAALLAWTFPVVLAQEASPDQSEETTMTEETTTTEEAPKLPPDQLDSLVAPIALYSDSLLAQTLAASTYPLEVIQLQQWMNKNKNLQGQALADAVSKQPWDPSVQGLVAFPDVVTRMAENIQWTTDLGNAFLAQQSDVMDSVQRMRAKAQGTGNLKTSTQQKVESKTVEGGKQVIEIQQASPDVAYVPSYDPTVVYGAASTDYPYPNYTYPGYVPGSALAWGAGVAVGAAAWGAWGGNWGNWGNCDWNHGDVNINNNNNFNKNYNKNVNRGAAGQSNQWQHNPQHRGGTPYANKSTANKYGGGTRPGAGRAGTATRTAGAGAGAKAGAGGAGTATRPGGGAAGAKPTGGGAGAKPGGGGAKPGGGGAKAAGGGGNKVGNHTASSPSKGGSAFGGGSSGGAARASSSRGSSSMGGPKGGGGGARAGGGGGGGARGGGGRGGGGKGGGGGRRR